MATLTATTNSYIQLQIASDIIMVFGTPECSKFKVAGYVNFSSGHNLAIMVASDQVMEMFL